MIAGHLDAIAAADALARLEANQRVFLIALEAHSFATAEPVQVDVSGLPSTDTGVLLLPGTNLVGTPTAVPTAAVPAVGPWPAPRT